MIRGLMMTTAIAVLVVLPATQASADCKGDIEAVEAKIKQENVRTTYKGREAEHPEVLSMADGRLVDLTGYIVVDASVQESWLGDRPVVENVSMLIKDAKGFADNKQEAECAGIYQKVSEMIADKGTAAIAAETAPATDAAVTGTPAPAVTAPKQ